MTDTPILHHFEASPFSEKIRVIFGFKRIAWHSVLIPRILPKPDLVPLTGGYRRTPVMQIGADVFCDTQIIIRELEARYPSPTLSPAGNAGLPWMVAQWADKPFFAATVSFVFGSLGDKVPQSFIDDRTRLRGATFDVGAMTAALPHHRAQLNAHLGLLEEQLADRAWLIGDFSLADASAYMNVWYVRTNLADADELLAAFPRVRDWESRVKAIGHGERSDISGEEALRIATDARPVAPRASTENGWKVGQRIAVVADEAVKTAIEGELVSISRQHVAVRRNDAQLGEVVVHFPRNGYAVQAR